MKKYIIIFILVLIPVFIFIAFQKKDKTSEDIKYPLLGVSGYVPDNYPKSNLIEIAQYWKNLPNEAQIYGIHANWNDVNTINNLSKNTKLPVELVLGFQEPDDLKKVDEVKSNIDEILRKNKNIKYIGIGNEINLIFNKYPNIKDEYIAKILEISKYIDSNYPTVYTFTSFQYDDLRGKAKLMNVNRKSSNFNDVIKLKADFDLIAFTVYPFLEYENVKSIPSDYLIELNALNIERIGITETSWPTQSKIDSLKELKYSFSEQMQVEYIDRLRNVSKEIENLQFLNIVFMNDMVDWKKNGNTNNPLFDSLGLKFNNGEKKLGYTNWLNWVMSD